MAEIMPQTLSFTALAMQLKCYAVNRLTSRVEAREIMMTATQKLGPQVAAARAFIGSDCRLVVLPEYWLTGFPMQESIQDWRDKACLAMEDPIYDALATVAQAQGIFLAGNAYELDPYFPELYFQNCFIFDPSGNMVLRYRRLNSMYGPTPHDVWEPYLDRYGIEAIFPVVQTEIGHLAALASDEILFPEVARCLMLRGAEVLVHPTSEVYGSPRAPKDVAKISRAVENMLYVISANTAGIVNTPILDSSVDGGSKVIDYRGLVLAETGAGESMAAYAAIDIEALRRYRRRSGIMNVLSRQRLDAYADLYKQSAIYPANSMVNKPVERSHFLQVQKDTIQRLIDSGVIQ